MSGLIAFTGPPDPALAARMLSRLAHRGSVVGTLEKEFGTIAVCEWPGFQPPGKSKTGIFPASDPCVGFSGFAFSPPPLIPGMTELAAFRGSFAAAWLHDGQLSIARDAHGNQSLYYGRVGSRWLVATEPKAITEEKEFARRIAPSAIAQYLSFSFVPGRNTMLESLFEAEAGHLIGFEGRGEPKETRYFRFELHEPGEVSKAGDQYWIDRTRQAIEDSVAERMPNEQPVLFLSGGLDSSIIAAEVARQYGSPIRTYSIHFGKEYPNELEFARSVALRIGSQHEEVLIRPENFLPRLRQMIWHLDEPIGDPITQPNYDLSAHVSPGCSFVFNGEGGDPVFGGPKNIPMLLMHWYGGMNQPENFREQGYLASYRRAYEEWSRLLTDDVRRHIEPERDLEEILKPFFRTKEPAGFLNKLMAINIRLKGANLILPKVDRMLAAHSLTPLSPLFDDRLTNLSFEMPPQMKLRTGIEKYVLKKAYEGMLPKEVINRPKSGMRVPVHYWFRGEMRSYAKSVLSKRNIQRAGIFDPNRVKQLLDYESEEGPSRFGMRLWMLLTFEIWRRILVEREPV